MCRIVCDHYMKYRAHWLEFSVIEVLPSTSIFCFCLLAWLCTQGHSQLTIISLESESVYSVKPYYNMPVEGEKTFLSMICLKISIP